MARDAHGDLWLPASSHPLERCFADSPQLIMADLLKKHDPSSASPDPNDPINSHWSRTRITHDETISTAFAQARVDVRKTISILKGIQGYNEASRSCVEILQGIYGPNAV